MNRLIYVANQWSRHKVQVQRRGVRFP